ncbi:MAG TPA: alpha/beta hydrolase [Jatrophihabitans sp.]|jgi:alpha-beta hydrolase superfamily lysophospholipase|uniref:alpha/beta hydrolase n=1 Tax=Jatrophihabitans sp. TaxID=1932789 RepID=UPI002E0AF0F0|nr:alpha/beta hydrolase [Jatrophihabitans sp.]
MTPTTMTFTSEDDLDITAYEWTPNGAVRGIVQLTHGMGEHALRYEPLATELTARGFAVVAQDHRGHGATAGSVEQHGHLGRAGWPGLVRDIGRLGERARADFPDVPLVLLGHSMGSFAAQQYALDHSTDIDALALTGTAVLDLLEPQLKLDQPLDLAMFNSPFTPARTDYDWLSRDEAQVDLYVADPACGFGLDQEGTVQMFECARPLADPARVAAMRGDLPVWIAAGEHDPVHGQLTLLSPLIQRYTAQLSDVTVHIYPGARHEVFNETNRDEVVTDLITWLDRVVPPTS